MSTGSKRGPFKEKRGKRDTERDGAKRDSKNFWRKESKVDGDEGGETGTLKLNLPWSERNVTAPDHKNSNGTNW